MGGISSHWIKGLFRHTRSAIDSAVNSHKKAGVPAEQPRKYWLSNLQVETPLRELVYWAKIRWWVEQNYQRLKDDLGLDHFGGDHTQGDAGERVWNA